jgi:hypothetical protein
METDEYQEKAPGRIPDYSDPKYLEDRSAETKRRSEQKDEAAN